MKKGVLKKIIIAIDLMALAGGLIIVQSNKAVPQLSPRIAHINTTAI